ncbi:UNVERIFIED_CONTAM: hypothetical protein K2H54_053825 [Gekko kuhli]
MVMSPRRKRVFSEAVREEPADLVKIKLVVVPTVHVNTVKLLGRSSNLGLFLSSTHSSFRSANPRVSDPMRNQDLMQFHKTKLLHLHL